MDAYDYMEQAADVGEKSLEGVRLIEQAIKAADAENDVEAGYEARDIPREFQIDMLRCIYCGMCEEACPEQAIFMSHNYLFTPTDKTQAIHNKAKLYELGGTRKGLVNKWNQYK